MTCGGYGQRSTSSTRSPEARTSRGVCQCGARQHRAVDRGAPGVRLVQAAYHNRSLALYAKLGFSVQESLPCMQGPAVSMPVPGYAVRSATPEDIAACDALCRRVHGHHRHGEVADTVNQNGALVVEHDGRSADTAPDWQTSPTPWAKPTNISRPSSARHPSSPAPGSSCRSRTPSWSAGA